MSKVRPIADLAFPLFFFNIKYDVLGLIGVENLIGMDSHDENFSILIFSSSFSPYASLFEEIKNG